MSNGKNRHLASLLPDRLADFRFGQRIERAGCLVENEQTGTMHQRTRQCQTLALTTRNHLTALPDNGIDIFRQAIDKIR